MGTANISHHLPLTSNLRFAPVGCNSFTNMLPQVRHEINSDTTTRKWYNAE